MKRSKSNYFKIKRFSLATLDAFVIILAVLLTLWILQATVTNVQIIGIISIFILVFSFVQMMSGEYQKLWRYASSREYFRLILELIFASIISSFIAMIVFLNQIEVMLMLSIITIVSILATRIWAAIVRRELRKEYERNVPRERVVIIGAGEAAHKLIGELKSSAQRQYEIIGAFDDAIDKQNQKICGVPVVGTLSQVHEYVTHESIDSILLAIPSLSDLRRREVIQSLKDYSNKLKILPRLSDLLRDVKMMNQIRDVELEELLGREIVKLDPAPLLAFLQGEVIFISGAGGSIGSELCRQIIRYQPKMLIIFDIYENSLYEIQNELKALATQSEIVTLIGSIRDCKRIESIFQLYQPTIVFHAAAHKHVPLMEMSPNEAIKNNIFGTLNVAQCASEVGVKRFVMISTDKAVNPTNIMGATKRACEMIVQAMNAHSQTEFVSVRFGNVLGSNGSVIPLFKKQIQTGQPITLTHKDITRYFMLIPEAVQLVLQSGAKAKGGEIFVLDMGNPVKIHDLAVNLIKLSGLVPGEDVEIKITGLRPGEKLYEELLMNEDGLEATNNKKIFVEKALFNDLDGLLIKLEKLQNLVTSGETQQVKMYLKEVVPTYVEAEYNPALYEKQ
ncbi:MAG: polysaccharide biosynthesis protein [Culicoidibacterales bacterium]